jgi:hypothetical protein
MQAIAGLQTIDRGSVKSVCVFSRLLESIVVTISVARGVCHVHGMYIAISMYVQQQQGRRPASSAARSVVVTCRPCSLGPGTGAKSYFKG